MRAETAILNYLHRCDISAKIIDNKVIYDDRHIATMRDAIELVIKPLTDKE